MNQERQDFGNQLRESREAKALSLDEIAKVTKIPPRALERLEEGSFEDLPADVFVRGFLRSYCRVIGLDSEDMVRRYGELTRGEGKAKPTPSLAKLATPAKLTLDAIRRAAENAHDDAKELTEAAKGPPRKARKEEDEPSSFASALSDSGTRRVSLTLAVIILVIVATLTLSLLLRRPSHVGDGLSRADITVSEQA